MTKNEVWNRAFEAAEAQGLSPLRAGQVADVKAQEWASAQHFAAASMALEEAGAYHALSVRDSAIDRKWAERLLSGDPEQEKAFRQKAVNQTNASNALEGYAPDAHLAELQRRFIALEIGTGEMLESRRALARREGEASQGH